MSVKGELDFVRCHQCRKFYDKLAPTLKEQRKLAERDGWSVAIPEWMTVPSGSVAQWKRDHPERKSSKVDTCPACKLANMRKAVESLDIKFSGKTEIKE